MCHPAVYRRVGVRRIRQTRASWIATASLLAAIACRPGEQSTGEGEESTSGSESETGEPVALGDECETTPFAIEAPTTLEATLRDATPSASGSVCGMTGPSVFARVHVSGRVDLTLEARGYGFDPRVAVLRPGCSQPVDDRLLACGHQLPVTVFDIGPDVELLVAIGAEEEALEMAAASEGEPDPLDFELAFTQRAVLAEGQRCGPDHGRCEAGTVCLLVEEEGFAENRCTRPPADSCAAPGVLVLPEPGSAISLVIPPDEPHSDAHEHECTGWRRPDRVDRLELPPPLPTEAYLLVRADDPRVGLALRGSSCAPEDALACTPSDTSDQTVLVWGGGGELSALAEAGEAPLLFVELPRSDVSEQPVGTITVELEIASP